MKPAREPASSRPKPCASLKKPPNLARSPLLAGLRRNKTDRGQRSAFPPETLRFAPAFDSRAQRFTPLARRSMSCPPPSLNLVRTDPIERYQALRDSSPCLSRATNSRKGHQIGTRKRRTPGSNIALLNHPKCRRRVSTDRLNREDSQLAASLEGEPGPTPAGKTLPRTHTPKPGIRGRERARGWSESKPCLFPCQSVICLMANNMVIYNSADAHPIPDPM